VTVARTTGAPAAAGLVEAALRLLAAGDAAGAEPLLRRALRQDPRDLRALKIMAQLQQGLGRSAAALAAYEAVLAAAPGDPDGLFGRAGSLMALGRNEAALTSLDRLTTSRPDLVGGHLSRGVALSVLRRFPEAVASFDRALEIEPGHVGACNNRGVALQEMGCLAEALDSFDRALRLYPDHAPTLGNRGALLRELGRHAEAAACCQKALMLNPADWSAMNNLGLALQELRRLPEAEEAFRRVLAVHPEQVAALGNLADVLAEMGRFEEALDLYDGALERAPDSADVLDNLGLVLHELGLWDDAVQTIDCAVKLEPRRARSYHRLARIHHLTLTDPRLAAMEALAADPEGLSPDDMVELNYGLGRAYAGLGDHMRAFDNFAEGARRKRSLTAYDERAELGLMERIARAFSAEAIRRGQGVGDLTGVPVFVVGMPRSGASLAAGILAAHPEAASAREAADFSELTAAVAAPGKGRVRFPEDYASLRGPGLRAAGAAYARRVRAREPEAAAIVDAVPLNFRLLGLIHLALPRARIIHVRRDPLDTCLSCFTHLFRRDHPYSYDLGELGRHHRAHQALMDHWTEVLPEGAIFELRYEDLVRDPEAQARRLVAHCGLDWDPACLEVEEAGRFVRRPIHARSIGRWRRYEPWLGPLIEALGPDLADDARGPPTP